MLAKPHSQQQADVVRLPPRGKTRTRYSWQTRKEPGNALQLLIKRSLDVPAVILAVAAACIVLTLMASFGLSAWKTPESGNLAQRGDAQNQNAAPAKAEPVASVESVRPQVPDSAPNVRPVEKEATASTTDKPTTDENKKSDTVAPPLRYPQSKPQTGVVPGSQPAPPVAKAVHNQPQAGQVKFGQNLMCGKSHPSVRRRNELLPGEDVRLNAELAASKAVDWTLRLKDPDSKSTVFGLPFELGNGHAVLDFYRDSDKAAYTQDPLTGVFFAQDQRWHVPNKYFLPFEEPDIDAARMTLRRDGIIEAIELQWWYPRVVIIPGMVNPDQKSPSKANQFRLAKMRLLAIVHTHGQDFTCRHLRNLHVRGTNPPGLSLIEADAIFCASRIHPINRKIVKLMEQKGIRLMVDRWDLVSLESLKESPSWFPDDERTVKKAATGQLPVKGVEIEAMRNAVHAEVGNVREVKWWPPRRNPVGDRHRLSKLRFEVNRPDERWLDEIVYDHNLRGISDAALPVDLFNERDKHTTTLERSPK